MNIAAIERVSKRHNKEKVKSFSAKNAEQRFWGSAGISLSPIVVPDFEKEGELDIFKAMHYTSFLVKKESHVGGTVRISARCKNLYDLYMEMRNRIITDNRALVFHVLKRQRDLNIIQEKYVDAVLSVGDESLIRATECFDPWRNIKFSTFACTSIMRGLSRGQYEELKNEVLRNMFEDDEFAEHIKMKCEEFIINAKKDEESKGYNIKDFLIDSLKKVMSNQEIITQSERSVIYMRYGFRGCAEKTLRQIGEKHGYSKERARQIELKVKNKIKEAMSEILSEEIKT